MMKTPELCWFCPKEAITPGGWTSHPRCADHTAEQSERIEKSELARDLRKRLSVAREAVQKIEAEAKAAGVDVLPAPDRAFTDAARSLFRELLVEGRRELTQLEMASMAFYLGALDASDAGRGV